MYKTYHQQLQDFAKQTNKQTKKAIKKLLR